MARGCDRGRRSAAKAVKHNVYLQANGLKCYFEEATKLCERDAGRLWGVSLCGPMVIVDRATGTRAHKPARTSGNRHRPLGVSRTAPSPGAGCSIRLPSDRPAVALRTVLKVKPLLRVSAIGTRSVTTASAMASFRLPSAATYAPRLSSTLYRYG